MKHDFASVAGYAYQGWASTNLTDWVPLGWAAPAGPGPFRFGDADRHLCPHRFDRVARTLLGAYDTKEDITESHQQKHRHPRPLRHRQFAQDAIQNHDTRLRRGFGGQVKCRRGRAAENEEERRIEGLPVAGHSARMGAAFPRMDYDFSSHVQDEMRRRGIPLAVVESVLAAPQQKVPEHGDVTCYQSQVDINQTRYLVRVMVNETLSPTKVVTVYRTSKISKYWKPKP